MNNGIPSKAAVPKAPKISMITLSIRIPSTASNFLINAFKSRGFGGEIGLDASETVDYNVPVAVVRENTQLCTYFFNLFTPTY